MPQQKHRKQLLASIMANNRGPRQTGRKLLATVAASMQRRFICCTYMGRSNIDQILCETKCMLSQILRAKGLQCLTQGIKKLSTLCAKKKKKKKKEYEGVQTKECFLINGFGSFAWHLKQQKVLFLSNIK